MAWRDTARYAAMSDPGHNRWFNYPWVLPPPLKRKRRPAGTGTADFDSNINEIKDNTPQTKAQARATAEQLFSPRGDIQEGRRAAGGGRA